MDWAVVRDLGWEVLIIVIGVPIAAIVVFAWKVVAKSARGIRPRPTLVYVSTGGSCRDPMAKVITEELRGGRKPAIEVRAVGIGSITSSHASKPARHVIKEMFGRDLLARHVPENLSPDLAARATLILCMGANHVEFLLKTFPAGAGKIHAIKPFFGETGDIEDPFRQPDDMSAEAIARYQKCARELYDILSRNIDQLATRLAA